MWRVLAVIFVVGVTSQEPSEPIVHTPLGVIEGFIEKTINGNNIYAFEGIPYARRPVGDLRFEKPVPLKPWKGVWPAKTVFKCMQYDHFSEPGPSKVHGDEDCLYVNVYIPDLDAAKKLDVLVYIHGGAFMFNFGAKSKPDILLDRNVILVTLNYRLGPLGFLSTEDETIPANVGMRDQIMALTWIKENIEYFGGNPDSITIMGLSAGGASVQTHLVTPLSKGLVSKAISESGVVLNCWALVEKPLKKAKALSKIVECPTESKKEMIKCLKSRPARQLVDAVKHFQPWLYNPFSPFGLVVDSWANDAVFPEHPYQLLKNGRVQDLPWMISYTTAEGLYPASDFYNDDFLKYIDQQWNELLPYILHYSDVVPSRQLNEISSKIRKEYLQDKPLNKRTFSKFVDILSDRLFVADIELASRLYVASVKSSVYSYKFNYRGVHSKSEKPANTTENIGVSHGDDTSYIMNFFDVLSTKDDREMSKMLVDMVVSFMKTGQPNITSEWLPLSKKQGDEWRQLRIDSPHKIYMEKETEIGNREFWESLPFRENQKLFETKDELR